jgi:hypothetical protein
VGTSVGVKNFFGEQPTRHCPGTRLRKGAIALSLDTQLWKVDDARRLGQWSRPAARLRRANIWCLLHLLLLLRRPRCLIYYTHCASVNSNMYKVGRQRERRASSLPQGTGSWRRRWNLSSMASARLLTRESIELSRLLKGWTWQNLWIRLSCICVGFFWRRVETCVEKSTWETCPIQLANLTDDHDMSKAKPTPRPNVTWACT